MNSIARAAFEIVPFRAEHLAMVRPRDVSSEEAAAFSRAAAGAGAGLQAGPFAYSGIERGRVVICAGVYPHWEGRAQAWAVVGEVSRHCWPAITAKVLEGIAATHAAGYRRIEATVVRGFPAHCAWLRRMGFERRCLLPLYDSLGRDHWLYDRVAGLDPARAGNPMAPDTGAEQE